MNLEQLRKENPGVYQQCVDIGVQQHRKDLLSHLPKPGPGATAWQQFTYQCIADGTPLTDLVRARHGAHAMRAARRGADSEQVVRAVERALGVGHDA